MSHKGSIVAALLVGWVVGAGSWYFIATGQDAGGGLGPGGVPSVVPQPFASGGELVAVLPLLSGLEEPPEALVREALPPAFYDSLPDMAALPPMEDGEAVDIPPDDGVARDTGEFIDADDPQAYIAHLNTRTGGEMVQDTGEFIDVDNPLAYTDSDVPPRDTGEFIDVDDPQAYAAYWGRQSDGVVRDTGEFMAVDAWQVP